MLETAPIFKKDHIRLFSGTYLNLLEPAPTDIFLIDIAVGLARECRWGNHCKRFYSVAEHSMECMAYAELYHPREHGLAFQCLMHDAHEAYLGDIPTPLKNLMPIYNEIAERVQKAINIRFRLLPPYDKRVKQIDEIILHKEWRGKNIEWTGLQLDEKAAGELFIQHVVRLCQTTFPIMP